MDFEVIFFNHRNGALICQVAEVIQESVDDYKKMNEDADHLPSKPPQVYHHFFWHIYTVDKNICRDEATLGMNVIG